LPHSTTFKNNRIFRGFNLSKNLGLASLSQGSKSFKDV